MFNTYVMDPVAPLTRSYVNNLLRVSGDPDYSLISTATAIIRPRVENYRGVDGSLGYSTGMERIAGIIDTISRSGSNLTVDTESIPAFYFMICNLTDDRMSEIRKTATYAGLKELSGVETFVAQHANVRFMAFTHEENNAAVIVTGSGATGIYHLSLSFMPLLFPKIFKDKPLTKEELEILKGLTKKTIASFITATSAVLEGMKTDILRSELIECFKGFRVAKLDQAKAEMDRANNDAEELLKRYSRQIEMYNEYVLRYEGLKATINNGDSNAEETEIVDYLTSCSKLHNIRFSNGLLSYWVSTIFTNFDLEKWNNAVTRSNIYDNYRLPEGCVFNSRDNRRRLFDNIFNTKPKLYVRIKGNIQLNVKNCTMSADRSMQIDGENVLENYLPNPHYKHHGCPGRYREQISRILKDGDIVTAVECSIAATGSVNIAETEITFRPFLQEILSSTKKIIETETGEVMTPEEALKWLENQN